MTKSRPNTTEMVAALLKDGIGIPDPTNAALVRQLYDFHYNASGTSDSPTSSVTTAATTSTSAPMGTAITSATTSVATSVPSGTTNPRAGDTDISVLVDEMINASNTRAATSLAAASVYVGMSTKSTRTHTTSATGLTPGAPSASVASGAIPKTTSRSATTSATGAPITSAVVAPPAAQPMSVDDMADEIVRLETQERLFALRIRVAELEAASSGPRQSVQPHHRRVKASDVDGLVLPFSGDDDLPIDKWLIDFDNVMTSLGADDNDRYRMCRHLLRGSAFTHLYSEPTSNWVDLRAQLLRRFHRQVSSFEVYERLRRRVRQSSESTMQYVTAMQFIAARSTVPPTELVAFIVAGMSGHSHYISILASSRSMDELIASIPNYDRLVSASQSTAAAGSSASAGAYKPKMPQTIKKPAATSVVGAAAPSGDPKQIRCYNCSRFGHISADCPQPRRAPGSCFRCGSTEHRNADCPKKRKPVGAITQPEGNEQDRDDGPNDESAQDPSNLEWSL